MTEPIVRAAITDEVAAVRSVVEAAYAPYLDRMATPPAPMLDDYEALIGQRRVWVAELEGVVVGVIAMWAKADHWYIDNIAMHPTQHGRGLGARLLDFASETAAAHDRSELRLYTNEVMVENLDYYPRRGSELTHRGVENGYERVYFRRSVTDSLD